MKVLKKLNEIVANYFLLFKIVKISKTKYFCLLILTLLMAILDAIGIGVLLPIAEYILNYNDGAIPNTSSWKVLKMVFSYLGLEPTIFLIVSLSVSIIILRQVIVYVRAFLLQKLRFKTVKALRRILFNRFLTRDLSYIKGYSTGAYNNLINLEVDNVGKSIILPIENLSGLILTISYLLLMAVISLEATIIVFLIVFLTGLFLKKIIIFIQSTAKKIIKINNSFSQNLVDRLLAIKLIRVNNTLNKEEKTSNLILNDQFENNLKLAKIQIFTNSTLEPFLLIIAIPIIVFSIKVGFSLAKLGVFVILLARLIPVFKVTITSIQTQFLFLVSIKNMLNLLDFMKTRKEIRAGSKVCPKKIENIVFKKVSFKYEDSESWVLNKFSCKIVGGVINAVVGKSGTGKTTLIGMITRLMEPQIGIININKNNIKEIDSSSLRNQIAYIDQKASFIRGNIMDHIGYGNVKLSQKKCIEAAKLANAHEFICKLPNKYNNSIGEAGAGLSGGQLQRIDIARGIASEKQLMILDEPTSNLDIKNTKDIFLTLKKINRVKKITIIVISHDKSILKYCNNIINLG